ncbi:hypothetical protein DPMN_169977 [Dreissena polymorpha]|uniref:Fibronectin type-III domain-containing protein n=1 Tax=Dreissena polymorpha TaxID=45954 RepID=A0A9D4DXR6_DREPO|nr:hypothetical protein DPMN_169977 [Dreissena polymorpha]
MTIVRRGLAVLRAVVVVQGARHASRAFWKINKTFCETCNAFCYNGGVYQSGSCLCQSWRSGDCCEQCRQIYIAKCLQGRQECGGSPDAVRCTQCENGYTSGGYGKGCKDVDECRDGTERCSHGCENTAGSYRCTCSNGYLLNSDGQTCRGPPQAPHTVQVLNEKYNSAEVSWLPGFHGGYPQIFVIQTSTDAVHWKNVSLIDGGTYNNESSFNETLTGLEPETLYWIRLFSFNKQGTSDYSIANSVTTTKAPSYCPPQAPHTVQVLNEKYNSAGVSWLPGFYGGYPQTFVIQTSTDAVHWKNVSLIDGGTYSNEVAFNETLSGLEPETLYWIRLFSFNKQGTSDYSIANNVTTTEAPDQVSSASSSKAGVITGGIVGGLIGLLAILMTVVAIRKYELMLICKDVRKPESSGQVLYETPVVSAINNGTTL